MGLLAGSLSWVRFTVEGTPPESFWDFVADRVAAFSFKDIDDTMDEYSIGWVSVKNMFDADFAYASYAAGDYVVLSMRVDERKVSPAVLKKFVLKEEERVKKEKQVPKLGRRMRVEIKERVQTQLIRKASPVPALYDLYWNLADSTLFFFSTNKKAIALVEDLFKDTFDMALILQVPYLTAARLLPDDQLQQLERLQPAILI